MKRTFVFLFVAAGVLIGFALCSERRDSQPVSAKRALDGRGSQAVQPEPQPAEPVIRTTVVSRPAQPPIPPSPSADDPILTGRLVYDDGNPVRNASCANWIERAHEYRWLAMTTDAEGRFAVDAPIDFDGPGRLLVIRARSVADVECPWAGGRTALPDSLPLGETFLGDITLAELPLLVAGTVRDRAGDGIAGAVVYAMPAGLDVVAMRNPRLPEQYRCETDAMGRYRIYGVGDRAHLVVARFANMFQTTIPRFEPGATDIALELAEAGALEGSVMIGPNFDPSHLHVELSGGPVEGHMGSLRDPILSTSRPVPPGTSQRLSIDARGRFHADLLRPGMLRCAIHVRGQEAPLRVFDGLAIEAGITTGDSRLQKIELADLHTVRLQFVDPDSATTLRTMAVGIRELNQDEWCRRVLSEDGALVVTTTSGTFDVLVQQRGYRRQLIEGIHTDYTIVLSAGIGIRAKVHLGDDLPPGFEATLRLIGEEVATHLEFDHVEVPRSDSVDVTSGQTVTLTVPAPGTYRALIRLQTVDGPSDESMDVAVMTPVEIIVRERGITDPVEILVERSAVYRAARVIRTFFPK